MGALTRREFVAACISAVSIGVLSIAWDAIINEGHPAQSGEDDEEPPQGGERGERCTPST